ARAAVALGSSAACGDEVGYRIELLDRDRNIAADRESLLRQSQTERSALGAARRRGEVSGSARSWRHSGRGQGDGTEAARDRHSEGRRPGASRRPRSRTALWKMGAGAGGEVTRRGCGWMVRQ